VLHELEPRVDEAERGHLALFGRAGQRHGRVDAGRVERLEHEVGVRVEVAGDLLHRGRASELLGQDLAGLGDLPAHLLQPTGHAQRPAAVAEVPPDLPEDGGDREAGERAALGVEPVDGVQQADGADLDEVVVRLTPAAEPLGEVVDQRELGLHEVLAQGDPVRVAGVHRGEPAQQLVHLRRVAVRRGHLEFVDLVDVLGRGGRRGRRRSGRAGGRPAPGGRGAASRHYVLRPPTCVKRIHEPWSETPVST
jgi:hypothetical protein